MIMNISVTLAVITKYKTVLLSRVYRLKVCVRQRGTRYVFICISVWRVVVW